MKTTNTQRKPNYFMVPLNYEHYNFKQLAKEYEENNEILWETAGKPKLKPDHKGYIIESKMANSFKKGDIIYLYVYNNPLTALTANDKSAVLLRGVVSKEVHIEEHSKIYKESSCDNKDTSEKVLCIGISDITALDKQFVTSTSLDVPTLTNLKNIDPDFLKPRWKTVWPNTIKGNLKDSVIKHLENQFTKYSVKSNIFKNY